MNTAQRLVTAVMAAGGVEILRAALPDIEHDPYRTAAAFLVEHHDSYGVMPSGETIVAHLRAHGALTKDQRWRLWDGPLEPPGFYARKLKEDRLWFQVDERSCALSDARDANNLEKYVAAYNELGSALNGHASTNGHRPNWVQEQGWTAASLEQADLPEPVFVIEKLLPEGFCVGGGSPKIGKTHMGFDLARSVAHGEPALFDESASDKLEVVQGKVLVLALEDGPRRLKKRLRLVGADHPDLHVFNHWPRMNAKDEYGMTGMERLEHWFDIHPDTRFVVIDTWGKFRPQRAGQSRKGDAYAEDYEWASQVQAFFEERPGTACLTLFHLNQGFSSDPLERISGTSGLTGAADTLWVLNRPRTKKEGTLFVTGRDIEDEATWDVHFNGGLWTFHGKAEGTPSKGDVNQGDVLTYLPEKPGEAISVTELVEQMAFSAPTIRRHLKQLAEAGRAWCVEGNPPRWHAIPKITVSDDDASINHSDP